MVAGAGPSPVDKEQELRCIDWDYKIYDVSFLQ